MSHTASRTGLPEHYHKPRPSAPSGACLLQWLWTPLIVLGGFNHRDPSGPLGIQASDSSGGPWWHQDPSGLPGTQPSPLTLAPASSSDPKVAPAATDGFSGTRFPVSHCDSRPPATHSSCWLQWSQAAPMDPGSFCSPKLPAGSLKAKVHPTVVEALGRSCGSRQLPQVQVLRGPLKTQASHPPGTGQLQQPQVASGHR